MSRIGHRFRAKALLVAAAVLLPATLPLAGCGRSGAPGDAAGNGRIQVVAAENFWGSIAAQLAGEQGEVSSIVTDPATDPHDYEPTAADARTVAGAQLAIVNGIGYDGWMDRLLQASPAGGRTVLDVGKLLGLGEGQNPHQWYSPRSVRRVADAIAAGYARLDPAKSSYFAARRQAFLTRDLARYDALRREIRARYAGTPVGYSESIFRPLGEDLGLRLMTPYGFAKAVAEGTELTAAEKQTVDQQARGRQIEVWVFNSQNVTPEVQRVNEIVRERGIPVATVTETLTPRRDSFEQWQVAELEGLARALHRATGR
ncbi:MAG TPA: zinc ABC transporter substrate-binding protein [Solirubrobacteraceae bacterium]|nr:zinc ABC transporter substrate-binding protein [Solirubrobacteraceae bacterium]